MCNRKHCQKKKLSNRLMINYTTIISNAKFKVKHGKDLKY